MPTLERVFAGRRVLLTGGTGFLGKTFLYVLLRLTTRRSSASTC